MRLATFRSVRLAVVFLIVVPFVVGDDGAPRQVYVKSYDGTYVAAALRKPAGNGPFAAVLFIHGGLGGTGLNAAENMLRGRVPEHFYKAGYVTFATDYRRFHFGEDEIQDVLAAYQKLASYPFIDSSRIGVIGGSHGGYLAQMLATRTQPAATVSFAGLSDIEGMFFKAGLELRQRFKSWETWHDYLRTHRDRAREQNAEQPAANEVVRRVPGGNAALRPGSAGYEVATELGWRYGERRDYFQSVSPKENVGKVRGPALYVVGGKDRLRLAGRAWIKALKERGVAAEYSEHADMPHGFYWGRGGTPPQQFYDALQVTSEFIDRHVGRPKK